MFIMDKIGCDKALLWQTLAKTTNYIANIASQREAETYLKNLQNIITTPSPTATEEDISEQPPLMRRISKRLFVKEETKTSADVPANLEIRVEKVDNKSKPQPVVNKIKINRRDSGISVTSNPSPYDNVPAVEFRRQGKGRVPVAQRSKLHKVTEDVKVSLQEPTKQVKCVPWIKVSEKKANSTGYLST